LSVAEARPPERSRLEADGLQKSYGARKVVKDVHLAVNSGEVVGLLGPNGAGKTTSFYMLVGLVRADAGQIRIDGESVQRLPIHQRARLGCRSTLPAGTTAGSASTSCSARCWPTCRSTSCVTARLRRCRVASGAASRSPARWRRSRGSSCSTSPSPASTRSR
jgi:energy-coupling factor transporter ATP-binding protein EcfA2